MRATQHSGRYSGGSQKHNDRTFDLEKAPHIDTQRIQENIYLPCYKGMTFAEAELYFYEENFADMIADINHRAELSRHKERCTTAAKLLSSKKTMPEEVIFQIGDIDQHASMDVLGAVFKDFYKWHQQRFGKNVKVLDIAFHVDESTPHIHLRRVWTYEHEKGFKAIGQHKALLELGYKLPDDNQKRGRFNNLKQQYTADCREKWLDICLDHGLDVEITPKKSHSKQKNIEKNDYILSRQGEKLQEQKKELDGLQAAAVQQRMQIKTLSELQEEKDKLPLEMLPEPKKTPIGAIFSNEQWMDIKNSFNRLKRKLEACIAKIAELTEQAKENDRLRHAEMFLEEENARLKEDNQRLQKSSLYSRNWKLRNKISELKREHRFELDEKDKEHYKKLQGKEDELTAVQTELDKYHHMHAVLPDLSGEMQRRYDNYLQEQHRKELREAALKKQARFVNPFYGRRYEEEDSRWRDYDDEYTL